MSTKTGSAVSAPIFEQSTSLVGIRRWAISSSVLAATDEHVRRGAQVRAERALCWAGAVCEGVGIVTTAILFDAPGDWGTVQISSRQTGLLYEHCFSVGLTLLAQVHSHPYRAFHSETDEKLPHSAERGFLSLVIPRYGAGAFDSFADWAAFEQSSYEVWREWTRAQREERLVVVDSVVKIA